MKRLFMFVMSVGPWSESFLGGEKKLAEIELSLSSYTREIMKAIILAFAVFVAGVANANSSINISGKNVISCRGSLSCINNKCTCDGVAMNAIEELSSPCSGETVIYKNGGGHKAVTAFVDTSVYLSEDSAVCDNAFVTGESEIRSSVISGDAQVYDSKILSRSSVKGVVKVIRSTVTASNINDGAIVDSSEVVRSILNASSFIYKSKVNRSILNSNSIAIEAQVLGSILNGKATAINRDSVSEVLN